MSKVELWQSFFEFCSFFNIEKSRENLKIFTEVFNYELFKSSSSPANAGNKKRGCSKSKECNIWAEFKKVSKLTFTP